MTDRHKIIQRIFGYFYYKIYRKFPYFDKQKTKKIIDNFLSLLSKHYDSSVANNFLVDYFSWAFSRREGQRTKHAITLNWIVGEKMFGQWLKKPDEYSWQYRQFLKEYSIDLEQLKSEITEVEVVDKLDPVEEKEKTRVGFGGAQLYNCLIHTTMYNHKSLICITCENKKTCKLLLKDKYPKIFKSRGYATIN